jgi:hypothetical protein
MYHRRHRLLTIACRQLADNYEENNQFEQASHFRKMANESKRLGEYKGFKIWSLHWWYWVSSLYGESWQRALIVLLGILLGFAFIYTKIDFQNCPREDPVSISITECRNQPEKCRCHTGGLDFAEAGRHSLAMAAFQTLEHRKPTSGLGETLVILEKIFAPLQAALLALAIRRKFMR